MDSGEFVDSRTSVRFGGAGLSFAAAHVVVAICTTDAFFKHAFEAVCIYQLSQPQWASRECWFQGGRGHHRGSTGSCDMVAGEGLSQGCPHFDLTTVCLVQYLGILGMDCLKSL